MLFARLAPLAAALVLAGNLAQRKVQATGAVGLSTSSALFAVLLLVIIVLIGALSLLPAFALDLCRAVHGYVLGKVRGL